MTHDDNIDRPRCRVPHSVFFVSQGPTPPRERTSGTVENGTEMIRADEVPVAARDYRAIVSMPRQGVSKILSLAPPRAEWNSGEG